MVVLKLYLYRQPVGFGIGIGIGNLIQNAGLGQARGYSRRTIRLNQIKSQRK